MELNEREIELIDGMIEVQLDHANRCDTIANRVMAEKQKGWDMERVALLEKIKNTIATDQLLEEMAGVLEEAKKELPTGCWWDGEWVENAIPDYIKKLQGAIEQALQKHREATCQVERR